MHMKLKLKKLAPVFVLALILTTSGAPAHATSEPPSVDDADVVYTPVKPTSERIAIDGELTDIAVMPGFDASAPAVVLDAGGKPVAVRNIEVVGSEGETQALSVVSPTDRTALLSCWKSWVAPGTGTWYTSVPGCSVIGISPDTTVGYTFTVDLNSLGSACLKGQGYSARHLPGGGTAYDSYYGGLGCVAAGGTGGGVVTWGEVASTKRVQAQSFSIPVGAAGMFK